MARFLGVAWLKQSDICDSQSPRQRPLRAPLGRHCCLRRGVVLKCLGRDTEPSRGLWAIPHVYRGKSKSNPMQMKLISPVYRGRTIPCLYRRGDTGRIQGERGWTQTLGEEGDNHFLLPFY